MVTLHNKRGGVIRLASDIPVYFGRPTQLTKRDADRILSTPLAKAYIKSGTLSVKRPTSTKVEKPGKAPSEKGKAGK